MGCRPTKSKSQVSQMVERDFERRRAAARRNFIAVGEMGLREMRIGGNYMDRTGNLRSSTGYVVADGGTIIKSSGFRKVGSESEGVKKGRALAEEIVSRFPNHLVLVFVAGMKYGVYVEALGYNVYTSAVLMAQRELPRLMQSIGARKK